jgi:hypothetical protein
MVGVLSLKCLTYFSPNKINKNNNNDKFVQIEMLNKSIKSTLKTT